MRAKNFVVNRGISCVNRGVSCFIRGVSCFIRGVSCFIRCILSCFIRCNPVFQSWSSRRERVIICFTAALSEVNNRLFQRPTSNDLISDQNNVTTLNTPIKGRKTGP